MTIRVFEHSGAALTLLRSNLLHQSAAEILSELGALLKYQTVMLQVNRLWHKRHAYLFETAVVVIHDGDDGFIPVSMNEKLDHHLKIDFLIHLRDIADMVPEKTPGATEYIYRIGFKERGKDSEVTLGFISISAALDWTTAIRRLQYQSQLGGLGYNEAEEVAAFESFAAIMQVFRWQLEISQPLGRVLYHGLVTIGRSVLRTATGWIQLVLFDAALVFIRGTPPEVKYLLLASRIISISEIEENTISLIYGTGNPDDDCLTEFRFRLQDANNDAATWLRMLHTFAPFASIHHKEHRGSQRLSQEHTREDSSTSTVEQIGTGVVGLAMLHTTSISDEFNISFAVNRSSESEGIATHLIAQVLELAFDKLGAHRVQARVVHSTFDPAQTVRAIRLLIHLGFTHEGVRRRAALHPNEKQWADVSVLAMVELDWVIRARVPPAKGTLWDEMFVRHQREREVLLKLEGTRELKRTRSMETVRDLRSMNDALPSASMASSSVGGSSVTPDIVSLVSETSEMSSWGGLSDASGSQSGRDKGSGVGSISSADDAADEYEEWDLDEDYSDTEDEEQEAERR